MIEASSKAIAYTDEMSTGMREKLNWQACSAVRTETLAAVETVVEL